MLYVDAYPKIGGGQQSLISLVSRISSSGRYLPLVACTATSPLRGRLSAIGVRSLGLPFNRYNYSLPKISSPASVIKSVISVVRVVRAIARLARREKIDLIHANSAVAGVHAVPAAMLLRVPCVVHARDFNTSEWTNRLLKLLLRYRRSGVIFVSNALARHYGGPVRQSYRYRVIHNVVDTSIFRPDPQARERFLREWDLPADCFLIGAVGRIERWKGFGLVLEAFANVIARHPQARLVVVGDVVFDHLRGIKRELQSQAHRLHLDGKVIFTGFREDMPNVMASIDALAHCPIEPEAFGLILIEAMACARPIVTVPVGGIPEVVFDGVNGLLVPPGDVVKIAEALSRSIDDPALAGRLGESGRRIVEERFSATSQTAQVEHFYDVIMKGIDAGRR